MTREEGGFFTRLAAGLAASGVTSLRFDLRAHGTSGGRESELTIASVTRPWTAPAASTSTAPAP